MNNVTRVCLSLSRDTGTAFGHMTIWRPLVIEEKREWLSLATYSAFFHCSFFLMKTWALSSFPKYLTNSSAKSQASGMFLCIQYHWRRLLENVFSQWVGFCLGLRMRPIIDVVLSIIGNDSPKQTISTSISPALGQQHLQLFLLGA